MFGASLGFSPSDGLGLRVKKLHPEAKLPAYADHGAVGLDLYACLPNGGIVVEFGCPRPIPTGIAISIRIDGQVVSAYEAQVRPRSGLARDHGLTVLNAPGTIDPNYRGEIVVLLAKLSKGRYNVHHGDRIAQLVIAPRLVVGKVEEVTVLDKTDRGTAGFGSTGR